MKVPPVVSCSGNHDFVRDRWLRLFCRELEKDGRTIEEVDGEEAGVLSSTLASSMFMPQRRAVVVHNPMKADLDLLKSYEDEGHTETIFVLYQRSKIRGNTKLGKWLKTIPGNKTFDKPKPWEMEDAARVFFVEEVDRLGMSITPRLASAVVRRIGTDFGYLAFEAYKMSILCESRGLGTVGVEEVKSTLAPLAEVELNPLFKSFQSGKVKTLARVLRQIEDSSPSDPTMKVCRIVGPTATQWFCLLSLEDQGLSPDQVASALGVKPWTYRNILSPPARALGRQKVVGIIDAFAEAERAVLSGAMSPWSVLVSRLLRVYASR